MTYNDLHKIRLTSLATTLLTEQIEQLEKAWGHVAVDKIPPGLQELREQLAKQLEEYVRKYEEAQREITKLPPEQALIMTLRYLHGLSWVKVADKAHYSSNHVYKVHRKALATLNIQRPGSKEGA